ncbi:MAG: hypothetical protein GX435_06815 [Exilispira sp.]|nr:hypothetical protein [Exilispira sp.]
MVFDELTLLDLKLTYKYSKQYQMLYNLIQETNRSEVEMKAKKLDFTSELMKEKKATVQSQYFLMMRSTLLPRVDSNHEPCR